MQISNDFGNFARGAGLMSVISPPGTMTSRQRIEAALDRLSRKQRLVAQYILANPSMALFATATEVAQRAGVDPATVVRFVQRLGFNGYPAFQANLRAEHPSLVPSREQFLTMQASVVADDHATLLDRVRAQTLANVERTFAELDWQALDRVAGQLLAARRVFIVSAGLSNVLGLQLLRVLQSIQVPADLLRDWYDLLFDAINIGPDDLVVGVTALRYSKVTVEALRLAREAGAHTVLVTDAVFAPGTGAAETILLFAPRAIAELFSPAAGVAIVDALAAYLAARAPDRFKAGLDRHIELATTYDLSYW